MQRTVRIKVSSQSRHYSMQYFGHSIEAILQIFFVALATPTTESRLGQESIWSNFVWSQLSSYCSYKLQNKRQSAKFFNSYIIYKCVNKASRRCVAREISPLRRKFFRVKTTACTCILTTKHRYNHSQFMRLMKVFDEAHRLDRNYILTENMNRRHKVTVVDFISSNSLSISYFTNCHIVKTFAPLHIPRIYRTSMPIGLTIVRYFQSSWNALLSR